MTEFVKVVNTKATSINVLFANLTYVWNMDIKGNPDLKVVRLPFLRTIVADAVIEGNSLARAVEMPLLDSAGTITISKNDAMVNVTLPKLTRLEALTVKDNSKITKFYLDGLQELKNLTVLSNPSLVAVGSYTLNKARGEIWIQGPLDVVNFPALTDVNSLKIGFTESISSFDFPQLAKAELIDLRYNKAMTGFTAPKLKQMGDLVLVFNSALTSCDNLPRFSALRSLDVDRNPNLERCGIPTLASVERQTTFQNNAKLASLDFPGLKDAGVVVIQQNAILQMVQLPNVQKIAGLYLTYNPALAAGSFPNLKTLSRIEVYHNPLLQKLDLSAWENDQQYFSGTVINFQSNAKLASIDIPKCASKNVRMWILANPVLTTISMPKVVGAEHFNVTFNPVLQHIDMSSLRSVSGPFVLQADTMAELPNMPVLRLYELRYETSVRLPTICCDYVSNWLREVKAGFDHPQACNWDEDICPPWP